MAKPFSVTDSDFEERVLKSDLPILVDFWAGLVHALQDDCPNRGGAV